MDQNNAQDLLEKKDLWDLIAKENENIKRGVKDIARYSNYAVTAERIKSFYNVFPDGAIKRIITQKNSDCVIVEAKVYAYYNDESTLLANGFAEEIRDVKGVNKESFIENAETSAISRALLHCGIGLQENYNACKIDDEEYVKVEQRIQEFRKKHPLGRIVSEIILDKPVNSTSQNKTLNLVMFKTCIYSSPFEKNPYNFKSEGTAMEDRDKKTSKGKDTVNTRFCIENAETSAIGRALGIGGYALGNSVATIEDISNKGPFDQEEATSQNLGEEMVSDDDVKEIEQLITDYNQTENRAGYLSMFSAKSFKDLTKSQFEFLKTNLNKNQQIKLEKENANK